MVEAAGGLEVLGRAGERSVRTTWEAVRRGRAGHRSAAPLTFDWFVLALTFLYTISAVRLEADRLVVERAR